MFNILKTIFSLCVFFPVNCLLNGQSSTVLHQYTPEQLLQETENLLGLDDLLVNGKIYRPERISANSPNFEWDGESASQLYIKGQCFNHVKLTYDIASDRLILNQPLNQNIDRQVLLHPEFVDSFHLGNHLFINPVKILTNAVESGYFEKISSGKVVFLKKYKKTFIKIYDSDNKGRYSPQKYIYYLMDQGKLININSRHAFLSYYRADKKNIREFIQTEGFSYRKASNEELKKLMTYCNAFSKDNR